jgi:hypothetical protein
VGKKGRPRNTLAERTPAGKAKSAKPSEQTMAPALWGRLKAMLSTAEDPLYASEVGRLVFAGELTRSQAEVGFRIRETYQRWHRSQRMRPSAKSANLESGYSGGADVAEERLSPDQIDLLEDETARIEANFNAVRDEIMKCPRNVRSAVLDVCVYDTATNPAMYEDLRRFLSRMAHFFAGGGKHRKDKKDIAAALGGFAQERPTEAALTPVNTKERRIHLSWRNALEKVVRKLLPKDEAEVQRVMKIALALRDLEEIRLKKAAR